MRIGIFFGGPAREREISFLGGKTAMAHLNKALFQPIPVFVDSLGNFILIKEELIFEESIRSFYPPKRLQTAPFNVYIESLPEADARMLPATVSFCSGDESPMPTLPAKVVSSGIERFIGVVKKVMIVSVADTSL